MQNQNAGAGLRSIGSVSWRYYNLIRKKAMDKEPGFSGLLLSMSIAFFIVIGGAEGLSFTYKIYSGDRNPAKAFREEAVGEKKLINRFENIFQYVARIRALNGINNALAMDLKSGA
ncbi:MAG: hypothetical protein WCW25_01785 [Patescibacteria group bacterium]|jgi:hypothetical protein